VLLRETWARADRARVGWLLDTFRLGATGRVKLVARTALAGCKSETPTHDEERRLS